MLDYTKIKKKKFPVKLRNGKTLMLTMPRKKTFEKMANMENTSEENGNEISVEELYEVAAEILSNNLSKHVFSVEEVGEIFDVEDLTLLYKEYSAFASGVKTDPN